MDSIMALDLKDIDHHILDELATGRNVPSNLAEELDSSRQWIQQRLGMLEAAGHVENVGRGVYELVSDPREETDATAGREPPAESEEQADDGTVDREELVSTLEELEEENEKLQSDLEACRESLQAVEDLDVVVLRNALDNIEAAAERGDSHALQDALERARGVVPDA